MFSIVIADMVDAQTYASIYLKTRCVRVYMKEIQRNVEVARGGGGENMAGSKSPLPSTT